MSVDNRFKPPAAVVDDVGVAGSRVPMLALAVLGLLQLVWALTRATGFLELVSANAVNPVGLLFAVAGQACLSVAVAGSTWLHRRSQKLFVAAVVLFALCVWWVRVMQIFWLGPFVLGMLIAAIGWTLGRGRASAGSAAA